MHTLLARVKEKFEQDTIASMNSRLTTRLPVTGVSLAGDKPTEEELTYWLFLYNDSNKKFTYAYFNGTTIETADKEDFRTTHLYREIPVYLFHKTLEAAKESVRNNGGSVQSYVSGLGYVDHDFAHP